MYVVSVPGSTPTPLLPTFAFRPRRAPCHGGFVAVLEHFRCIFVDCCVVMVASCISVAVMSLFSCFGALLVVFCARVPSVVVMTMAVFSSFVRFPCVFVDCCITYDHTLYQGHDNVDWNHHGSFVNTIRSREATRSSTPAVERAFHDDFPHVSLFEVPLKTWC